MAWVKWSDRANSHPSFMKLTEIAADAGDPRLQIEVKGALFALAQWSAQTESDYIVPWGAAIRELGMERARPLIDIMINIGVLTDITEDESKVYKLIDDEEGLFHIIKRNKKIMDAKRKRDRNNGSLIVPVLLRDGAECRYTGEQINFRDTKNDNGGTFDHREPDEPTTPDNYVVASRGANSARAFADDSESDLPLMEPPENPIYDDWILDKLKRWPTITARTAKQMGIPNPLTDSVEAHPAPAASRATAPKSPSTPPSGTTGRQPESSPQFPSDSHKVESTDSLKVESTGRAAQEAQPRRAASSATSSISTATHQHQELSGHQPERDPQPPSRSHVRDQESANVQDLHPARKRRRRVRRR